ncbi:HEAT repeat domain-containing protein [Pelagicoccus sp. SDUM812002]|uniref:HEAT repeat domain-containing protein n=1 Tax=Pelagicoccus sp. SDUM812002 TaxID=3041266 RepID=UPI00280D35DA|nr:HEAT repeat domain-containing protein [Pelagicoccus sp. SDUM812002]MDQ8186771.1 HEAT repeat domain-containing protein [Pelagicoccus sp. SDUM812002]
MKTSLAHLLLIAALTDYSVAAVDSTSLSDRESEKLALEIEAKAPLSLADGLQARLWAPDQMLTDPVAIDVTDGGEVWVSATLRRNSSMFDIRSLGEWVPESWSWESVEERADFLRRELSPKNSDKNTWLRDFNEDGSHDWRDLSTEAEEVYRLLDQSGDGRADLSERFQFVPSTLETDIAGALLVHDNSIFLGVMPDMWRIQDLDGDGEYESKEPISSGYGIHVGFGGHGISGVKIGPDGRIYWGIGDVGFNGVDQEGKRWKFPRQGVLVRSELDGSGFEVYAHGLRNLHEFDWDAMGNLIGVDNDGDHPGEDERLVYLIDGSDTGWRNNWQLGKYTDPKNNAYKVWMDELYFKPRFDGQAAHILPALDNYHTGPAGLVFQPGTALGGRWKDHFLVASFTGNPANSRIFAYSLKPQGAAFALDNDEEILSGITAVGIDFGPEGALYLADWGGGWDTDGVGRVWKVDTTDEMTDAAIETQGMLAEGLAKVSPLSLVNLLSHEDRRVRLKAQFELVKRDEARSFLKEAYDGANLISRVHSIWGFGQLARKGEAEGERLLDLLHDSDAEVRAQAARTLGDIRCAPAAEELRKLLSDDSPRIRLMATEALGRIGDSEAYSNIIDMLDRNDDEEVYLRHAGAIALARVDDGDRLMNLAGHRSAAVRIAAVVALDRLGHPAVIRFLDDSEEIVATAAARAIGDEEHLADGIVALAGRLAERSDASEAFTRRAINANLYAGDESSAMRLARFAVSESEDVRMRIEAVDTLSVWADPSIYDRVSGRILPRPDNKLQHAQLAIGSAFDELYASENLELRLAAIEALGRLEIDEFEQSLIGIVEEGKSSRERIAALNALVTLESSNLVAAIERALADDSEAVRSAALEKISRLTLDAERLVGLLEMALGVGGESEVQAAIETLGHLNSDAANDLLAEQFVALQRGEFPQGALLELLAAAESSGDPGLENRVEAYRNRRDTKTGLARYDASLFGGDAGVGRTVVYDAPAAQCIRCHAIGEEGGDVGPDLAAVADRLGREELLESLVDPSAKIALGYGIVVLTTKEGQSIQGILMKEDSKSMEVKVGNDRVEVAKASIAERFDAPSSMPPMGVLLSDAELRDVVAFLSELKEGRETNSTSSAASGGHGE